MTVPINGEKQPQETKTERKGKRSDHKENDKEKLSRILILCLLLQSFGLPVFADTKAPEAEAISGGLLGAHENAAATYFADYAVEEVLAEFPAQSAAGESASAEKPVETAEAAEAASLLGSGII